MIVFHYMLKGLIVSALFLLSFSPLTGLAQEQGGSYEVDATITSIESIFEQDGFKQMRFTASSEDASFQIDTSTSFTEGLRYDLKKGDRILLQVVTNSEGEKTAYLADVVRTKNLLWITVFFVFLTIAVGFWRGFSALIGLGVTLGILFLYMFPKILSGSDPVFTTIIGSTLILVINMHLSHGVSRSTFFAFLSTVAGLLLAWIFSHLFVSASHLSGLANEEAVFLFWNAEGVLAPQGLLLAGIILGAVGVLDDIAIAQGEVVNELLLANPAYTRKDLFVSAMRVGRHHIASTVNTLVLAYAGAALPLILLFLTSAISIPRFLNTELVAEEVIRTLSGTSALVLTVPIATWLATYQKTRQNKHPN